MVVLQFNVKPGNCFCWLRYSQRASKTVSYTHLDVYKRQGYSVCAEITNESIMEVMKNYLLYTRHNWFYDVRYIILQIVMHFIFWNNSLYSSILYRFYLFDDLRSFADTSSVCAFLLFWSSLPSWRPLLRRRSTSWCPLRRQVASAAILWYGSLMTPLNC